MRKKIIAGNWKMNKTVGEAVALANGIKLELADCKDVDVVLCPPFTAIKAVSDTVAETLINVGAQNICSEMKTKPKNSKRRWPNTLPKN